MPNISLTMPETSQSVTRPVIYDMINQLQDITNISPKSRIMYPGDINFMQNPGTSIDSPNHSRNPTFNTDRYTFIEVEEDYDRNALSTTAVTRREHIAVFKDLALNVRIAPVYATSQVTINFKYRCPSKTEALRWRDDMRIRISQMRDINLHNVTYHYLLPMEFLIILQAIYTNREQHHGYGQSLVEYITSYASDRLTYITDTVNANGRLTISETQCRIIGMFDYDGIPDKPERDDQTGTWTIGASYKFSYEKPIACHMKYPIMVHNKLLPEQYITFVNQEYKLEKLSKSFSLSLNALNAFETDTKIDAAMDPEAIVRIPDFDDFNIPAVPNATGTLFIALTEVDPDNSSLLNLGELGDYILDKDILDFIRNVEYPYVCSLYKSIIHINLYRNEQLAFLNSLTCDTNGNIRTVSVCDPRNQHRVRFSLVTDLTLLDKKALDRLLRYPKVLVKLIGSMNDILRNHPDFTDYGDKNKILPIEFNPIYRIFTGYDWVARTGSPEWDMSHRNNYPCPYPGNSKFRGIDSRIIENYRRTAMSMKTVMNYGLIALRGDISEDKQSTDGSDYGMCE